MKIKFKFKLLVFSYQLVLIVAALAAVPFSRSSDDNICYTALAR